MQNYINYLLEDLYTAKINITKNTNSYDLNYTNLSFTQVPCKSMAEWFGIEQYAFPPSYKLSKKQTEQLNNAIIELWQVFNIDTIFPEEMSCRDRYAQLTRFWKHKVQYIPNSKWTVDWSKGWQEEKAL
ncbi:MAG: hypothetical protein AB8B69_21355 [Chitinophagales bacterium]